MQILPKSLERLLNELKKLPGVGPKSAARMAYFYLKLPKDDLLELSKLFVSLTEKIYTCEICCNYSDSKICKLCESKERDAYQIMVVEEPLDAISFEESGVYNGVYHILGGAISPVNGIGADELNYNELVERIVNLTEKDKEKKIEIVIATSPNMEGEATASYLVNLLSKYSESIILTSLARGLPIGGNIQYADQQTLRNAFDSRNAIKK